MLSKPEICKNLGWRALLIILTSGEDVRNSDFTSYVDAEFFSSRSSLHCMISSPVRNVNPCFSLAFVLEELLETIAGKESKATAL